MAHSSVGSIFHAVVGPCAQPFRFARSFSRDFVRNLAVIRGRRDGDLV